MATKHTDWIPFSEYATGIYPTLSNLHQSIVLGARCGSCGHTVELDRWEIARTMSKRIFVINLQQKLKCARCGNRKDNVLLCRRMER